MKPAMLRRLCVGLLCVLHAVAVPRLDAGGMERVDRIFARWDRTDSPGCALAAIRNGKIVYQRGYGSANLEHRIAITPDTVFNVGSVSKQFTAFFVMLLATAGLIDLDADLRTHIPELPRFGKMITVRHLLHHTSGLREDWSLLNLAGWRSEDVITHRDVIDLIRRQKELNFEPGQEYLYCNTGYDLLALLVERASGKSLRVYGQDKLFGPLGMKSTVFQDDFRMLIPNRAASYRPLPGKGFAHVLCATERAGPSNLYTTVLDLARWDQNFYDTKIGGKSVNDLMLLRGKLASGKELPYAAGLIHRTYRGQKTVEHGGVTAGYRAILFRIPAERFSVIIIGNVSDLNTSELARKVADVFLDDKLAPATKAPVEGAVDPNRLDELVGDYRFPAGLLTVTREAAKLMVRLPGAETSIYVRPTSPTDFFVADMRFTFGKGKLTLRTDDRDHVGERLPPIALTAEQLSAYRGEFHSSALAVTLRIAVRDEKLLLRQRQGEVALRPVAADEFIGASEGALTVRFTRAGGRVIGFTASTARARRLSFVKTSEHGKSKTGVP